MASTFTSLLALAPLALSIASCKAEPGPPSSGPSATPTIASAAPTAIAERGAQVPSAPATSASSGPSVTAPRPARTWTFDADKPGESPSAFTFGRTGDGRPGRWIIKAEPDAPSASNVLAQLDADDTDMRFPVAVANEPSFRDVRLSVKCKPVSGKVDQACGLVFRYKDENNYYLTRANALEGNVRLYYVRGGGRQQFPEWNGPVLANTCHPLRVVARGESFLVYFDGVKVIDAADKPFPDEGKVGVWTKADSITYFDDLEAAPW